MLISHTLLENRAYDRIDLVNKDHSNQSVLNRAQMSCTYNWLFLKSQLKLTFFCISCNSVFTSRLQALVPVIYFLILF